MFIKVGRLPGQVGNAFFAGTSGYVSFAGSTSMGTFKVLHVCNLWKSGHINNYSIQLNITKATPLGGDFETSILENDGCILIKKKIILIFVRPLLNF